MSTAVEAVIISGPMKGQFVRVNPDSPSIDQNAERAIEELIDLANQISSNLKGAIKDAKALKGELRKGAAHGMD